MQALKKTGVEVVMATKKLEIKKDGPNWDRQDIKLLGLFANVSKFPQI